MISSLQNFIRLNPFSRFVNDDVCGSIFFSWVDSVFITKKECGERVCQNLFLQKCFFVGVSVVRYGGVVGQNYIQWCETDTVSTDTCGCMCMNSLGSPCMDTQTRVNTEKVCSRCTCCQTRQFQTWGGLPPSWLSVFLYFSETVKPPTWVTDVLHQFHIHYDIQDWLAINQKSPWTNLFPWSLGLLPFFQEWLFFIPSKDVPLDPCDVGNNCLWFVNCFFNS